MNIKAMCQWILPISLSLALTAVCHACPTCKDGIAESGQQANMIRGYFWSILFMMSMPFLIFGGLGAYFYYQVRQARAAQRIATAGVTAQFVGATSGSVASRSLR